MEEIEEQGEQQQEQPPFEDRGDSVPVERPRATTFAKALQKERMDRGWTQRKLADMLGTSQQNVQGWESGKALPTEKFHQRMLEVFGEDSVLAYLQVKRSQLITMPGVTMTVTRADGTVKSSVTADPVMFQRRQETIANYGTFPQPPQFSSEALRDKLEFRLRMFVEAKVSRWKADYLSDRLCLEVKRVTGNRLDLISRTGMQQLCVMRSVLQKNEKSERVFMLVLLVGDLETVISSPTLNLMQREAAELDIEILTMTKLEAVVNLIDQVEAGAWGAASIDDFDPL